MAAEEFVPPGQPESTKSCGGNITGSKKTNSQYIAYAGTDDTDYPDDACSRLVHGNAQIDDFTINNDCEISGDLTVSGSITGTTTGNKLIGNFDIPHVRDSKKRIRHIVTEGPEPGIYVRGQLKDKNIIELPEYWDGLIDPESITVTLTQIGYSQDLIVDKIEWGKRIVVKSGTGANIHCFYEVWAARWLNPMNHDEKLTVVYEGDTPDDYPGGNENFLIGGWDYDRRETKWREG